MNPEHEILQKIIETKALLHKEKWKRGAMMAEFEKLQQETIEWSKRFEAVYWNIKRATFISDCEAKRRLNFLQAVENLEKYLSKPEMKQNSDNPLQNLHA